MQRTARLLLELLGRLPVVGGPIRRRAWHPWRHRWVLYFGARENVTFTQFMRLPRQYDALVGPVVDFLRPQHGNEPLHVVVFGCSNGAEPYSMASVLSTRRPDVRFDILALDIEPGMIEKAVQARSAPDEVNKMAAVDPAFAAATFIERDGAFEVRPEMRARVRFGVADVLDPSVIARLDRADIVVAQNFLYHLYRKRSRLAFGHLVSLLKPRSALLVDGMDIDMRQSLTKKAGLEPLDALIAEIHADALKLRGAPWPWQYWSVEPMNTAHRDWKRRYATIYLRSDER